jgi:hypothetical protein
MTTSFGNATFETRSTKSCDQCLRDSRSVNRGKYLHKVPSVTFQGPQSPATQIARTFYGIGTKRLEIAKNLVALGLLIFKLVHFFVIICSELGQFSDVKCLLIVYIVAAKVEWNSAALTFRVRQRHCAAHSHQEVDIKRAAPLR